MEPHIEPWRWSEEQWRPAVGSVRAGRSLPAAGGWPGGARMAVAVSFDADHETASLRDADTTPGVLSAGEYGSRTAVPRLLRLLRQLNVPATFFYPAVSALLHPGELDDVLADGHEIAAHGWIHERADLLTAGQERDLLAQTMGCLENLTTVRPVGVRAPSFAVSPSSLQLASAAGLLYDSSLMADDDPYEILLGGSTSGLVEIPVDWTRDDAAYFIMDRFTAVRPSPSAGDVVAAWLREFRSAHAEGGLFQLTLHPDLIGRRSRIPLLEQLLGEIADTTGVWLATHRQVAEHCRASISGEQHETSREP